MLDQNQLNEEMTALGISRYNNQIESAREQKETGRTKAGQTLIRELLPAFATAIKGISYKNKTKHNQNFSAKRPGRGEC